MTNAQNMIERRKAAIVKANEFTDQLTASNIPWEAREMAQGIEIKIHRPSFRGRGYASISYKIIPY